MAAQQSGAGRVPAPLTPILGREAELAAARELVGTHRLVTIVGAGGCGKTRLAVELAHDDPDAVFVDLAPLTDPALVLPTVARVLGLREAGARPVAATLLRHLGDRPALLVLDNLEHLLDAADDIVELLAGCAGVRVLGTSRAPVRVPGEQLLTLGPLPVPDADGPDPDRLPAVPSVALLLERIRADRPGLAFAADGLRTAAGICRALDGLPLALELAAAQVGVLGLRETLGRIRESRVPELPRRAVPDRHRSLDDAVGWSVALLDEPARRLYRRLSVFAGTWTAAAAVQVCSDGGEDVLPALVALTDQSLVEALHVGEQVRYRMLQTVREHAAGVLRRSGEETAVLGRHAGWCRSLAARVGAASSGHDELGALDAAESQLDDLRAALERCPAGDTPDGLRTAADLYYLWDMRGYLGEGCAHLQRLLDRPGSTADPAARAVALRALGLLLIWRNEQPAARAALEEAAALAAELGDPGGVAWCAGTTAISRFVGGDVDDAAVTAAEQGLAAARRVGARMPLLRTTCGLGLLRWAQGSHADAVALLEENAALVAPSRWGGAKADWFLGWFSYLEHDLDRAGQRFGTAAAAFEALGDCRSLPDCWDGLGCVAAARGEHAEALRLFDTAATLRERSGARRNPYLRPHCERGEEPARAAVSQGPDGVTPREHEVARLIAEGLTNRRIGNRLGISERTAERHAENLRAKLGVGTRAQIAAWVSSVPTRA